MRTNISMAILGFMIFFAGYVYGRNTSPNLDYVKSLERELVPNRTYLRNCQMRILELQAKKP